MKSSYLLLVFSLGLNFYFVIENSHSKKSVRALASIEKDSIPKKTKLIAPQKEEKESPASNNPDRKMPERSAQLERADEEEKDYLDTEDMTYDYSEKRRQYISQLKDYMIRELDIGLEEANRVLEIQEERSKELSEYMTGKLKKIHEKYGENAPYIYQAEDHIKLGKSIQKSSRRISKFLGQEKFEKLKEHVERNLYTGDGLHILEL